MVQAELAAALGQRYNSQMISMVEHNQRGMALSGAVAAARILEVSLDYLTGLAKGGDPPASPSDEGDARRVQAGARAARRILSAGPPRQLSPEERRAAARRAKQAGARTAHRILSEMRWTPEQVDIPVVAGTVGSGATLDLGSVRGHIKFDRALFGLLDLVADDCRVLTVAGESMEPTLPDGCSILVTRSPRPRRVGRIFVVRTRDGLVVKRAGKDGTGRWQLVSDNASGEWPPTPWPEDAQVVGEVRWAARTFA